MYSRKFDESAIPDNYAGNAFERAESDAIPREEEGETDTAPPLEEKTAPKGEQRDGDLLIPLIALWLLDRSDGRDLSPLLLLFMLWDF
jgi:hypothetical protein